MNGRYLPKPDRIIVEVPTNEERAYQFLFTRRITGQLINTLMPLLKKSNNQTPLNPKKKDTKKTTNNPSDNVQPKLVVKFLIKSFLGDKAGSFNLNFEFADESKMSFVISHKFLSNLYEILNELQKKAEWAIAMHKPKTLAKVSSLDYLDKKKLH